MADVEERLLVIEQELRRQFPNTGLLLLAAVDVPEGFTLYQVSGMTRESIVVVLEAAIKDIKSGVGNFQ